MVLLSSKNWLDEMVREYNRPNRILFRSVELDTIFQNLINIEVESPILDLGCGEGKIAKVLFGNIVDVGLDNTWGEIKKAKSEGIYRLLITGDAVRLPFDDQKFKFVFSNSVIEHIKDNANVLKEVSRILRPQGLFVFTVPSENFGNYLYFSNLFKKMGLISLANHYQSFRNKTLNHYHCYTPQEWEQRLKRVGLKLVKHQYYLSKEALSFWDLLAFKTFIIRKCTFWSSKDPLLKLVKRLRMHKWREKMDFYYHLNNYRDGGALLIIAQK